MLLSGKAYVLKHITCVMPYMLSAKQGSMEYQTMPKGRVYDPFYQRFCMLIKKGIFWSNIMK